MKNIYFFFLALMLSFSTLSAQNIEISPNDTVAIDVDANGYSELRINTKNISGTNQIQEWTTVHNDMPATWEITICDYTACHFTIPAGGIMSMLDADASGFLKLTVNPMGETGLVTLRFYLFDQATPSLGDTLTFVMNSIEMVGLEDELGISVAVYPNPATEYLKIELDQPIRLTAEILDLTGRTLRMQEIEGSTSIDVMDLAHGAYLLKLRDDEGRAAFRKFVR